MEISDDFLEENDRYAFLLGVALRNEDTYQFLEIYDKVLPKNLTQEEVENIKARAHWLSDLEEAEFSAYASRARNFSLAQPGGPWAQTDNDSLVGEACDMMDNSTEEEIAKIENLRSMASVTNSRSSSISSDQTPTNSTPTSTFGPIDAKYGLSRTSRHFATNSIGSVSDASDSGIGLGNGSGKLGSVSSDFDPEETERVGVLDYHPPRCDQRNSSYTYSTTNDSQSQGRIHKHTYKFQLSSPPGRIIKHTNKHDFNSDEEFGVDNDKRSSMPAFNPSANQRTYGMTDRRNEISMDDENEPLLSGKREFQRRYEDYKDNSTSIEMVQINEVADDSGSTRALATASQQKAFRKDMQKKNTMSYDEAYAVESPDGSAAGDSAGSCEEFQTGANLASESDDDNLKNVIVHQRLYGQSGDFRSSFVSMQDDMDGDGYEDDEESNAQRVTSRHANFNGRPDSSGSNYYTSGALYGTSNSNLHSATSSYGLRTTPGINYPVSSASISSRNTYSNSSNSYERELRFRSSKDYQNNRSYGTMPSVRPETTVNFGLKSSSNVRVEKSESSTRSLDQPYFGSRPNEKDLWRKSSDLMDSSPGWRSINTDNMPKGEPIQTDGASKKKKRRGNKKDEEKTQDINGNPLELGQAKSANTKASSPDSYSRPTYEFEGRSFPEERSRFPSKPEAFEQYVREQDPGIDPKEARLREKKARKQKKKEGESVKAENIPGYQGDKSLDEVLNFIGDNKAIKSATTKNNKKATPNGPSVTATQAPSPPKEAQPVTIAPAATTPNKEAKKAKKKQKSSSGSNTGAPLVANNSQKEDNSQDNASDGGSVPDVKEVSPVNDIFVDSYKSVGSAQANTKKSSGINSSKQMDAKTKKSASSNNTNNARTSASVKGDNMKDKEISTVLSNSESNDNYIFTDFDFNKAPQEEEFQTVKSSKKKKRNNQGKQDDSPFIIDTPLREPRGTYWSRPQEVSGDFYGDHRHRTVNHAATRKRAFTPPPPTSRTTEDTPSHHHHHNNQHHPDHHQPAFTLRSFPVLGRSGRRASTGNSEFEVENVTAVESDTESSVSERASSGRSDTVASSSAGSSQPANLNLPFSYAKIVGASGQAKTVDSPDDLEKSSGMGERRHSLGNINMIDMPPFESYKDSTVSTSVHRSQELPATSKDAQHGAVSSYSLVTSTTTSTSLDSSKNSSVSTSKVSSSENIATAKAESLHPSYSSNASATAALPPNPQSDSDFPTLPGIDMSRKVPAMVHVHKDSSPSHVSSKDDSVSSKGDPPVSSSSNISSLSITSSQPSQIPASSTTSIATTSRTNTSRQWRDVAQMNTKNSTAPAVPTIVQHQQSSSSDKAAVKPHTATPKNVVNKSSSGDSAVSVSKVMSTSSNSSSNTKVKSKNSLKTSSVIFLDKKFETKNSDLGISFGFDDDLADSLESNEQAPTSDDNSGSKSEVITDSVSNSTSSMPSTVQMVQGTAFSRNDDGKAASASSSNPVLPNGLVNINTPPVAVISPTTVLERHPSSEKSVEFTPKEDDIARSPNRVKMSPASKRYTLPSREDDPNYHSGHFDQYRAVQLLYEGWSRIEAQMKKQSKDFFFKVE